MNDATFFDGLADGLERGLAEDGWMAIVGALARRRALLDPASWRDFARGSPALERVKSLLRLEPFAQRASLRPRGRSWDAVSADLAYGIVGVPDGTAARAAEVHGLLRAGALCWSVRRRRELAAAFIDEVCTDHHFPRVLALGCGHARELAMSRLYALGRVGDFCAVDSDVESLRLLERAHAKRVRTIPTDPVKFIAAGPLQGLFHGIYAPMLIETLDDEALDAMLPMLLRLLRPGSRLMLATTAPTLPELAYLEAIMDWWPVCRLADTLARQVESAAQRSGLRVECTTAQEPELGWITVKRVG